MAAGDKIKRQFLAHYINATKGSGTAEYILLGSDLEEFNVDLNPNVESKKNILGETSVYIDSYEAQSSVEPYYATEGDALFERLQGIIANRETLDDLKCDVVEVHLWEEESSGVFEAVREKAFIEVSSYGGDTTGYQIPFNIHYTGERTKGKFDTSTKTFTAD